MMSSVPVSQYEALRAEMRNLVEQAQKVHEIATQVISSTSSTTSIASSTTNNQIRSHSSSSANTSTQCNTIVTNKFAMEGTIQSTHYDLDTALSEDDFGRASSTQMSVSSEPVIHNTQPIALYHGTWPVDRTMSASEPHKYQAGDGVHQPHTQHIHTDQMSVQSFASSSGGGPLDRVLGSPDRLTRRSMQQLEAKVDMVYSLLAMLGNQEHADMGDTLLALSRSPESCLAMRQSGCIPLLVQLVQSDKDHDTRKKASDALHNLIYAQPDEKTRKREIRVLKLLEQTAGYVGALKNNTEFNISSSSSTSESSDHFDDKHPVSIIANLMKHSFDEGHRQAICQLGGIKTIASLVETEHNIHGALNDAVACILMRRYACMALTNLTFGDSGNKALLCSFREFMRALVLQLQSPSDELRQVTASVLRNLSWRADQSSKEILREVGTVTGLMKAGMATTKENTLKSILSALWNLSAHCTENKIEICAVEKGLAFLVEMLAYKAPSSSLTINENAGGILRNISSQIAVRDDYREVLRKHNCLQMLLEQLKSPSLTIVSNACGTLWNLSAKNQTDQDALWQMGAPAMLRSLNHSKHKLIATGSSAALKNLLNSRPSHSLLQQIDSTARAMDLPSLPTLGVRKQKALMRDLDQNLSETFENIELSPTKNRDEHYFDDSILMKQRSSGVDNVSVTEVKNSFASLNLGEPSTSFSSIGSSNTFNYPSKFVDTNYVEQPVDFSRTYAETSKASSSFPMPTTAIKKPEEKPYSIYAETDLDQPTDYSLRYAEDDSGSDCDKKEPEYVQDTIKTYCTEGTPYETPINFSTATSLSDLRIVDIDNDKTKDHNKDSKPPNLSHLDEKDQCSVEDITGLVDIKPEQKPPNCSEFSSGMLSPEKPVNYCEEGTPGYFSRVSSFGSLTSISPNRQTTNKEEPSPVPKKTEQPACSEAVINKAVKFEANVNYADQTPLMFSRSSSLASLDSVEQHSIHDDRSSVISDFSRLTSGIVSPSELPDSPTQTVPPSPRPRKSIDYPSTSRQLGRPQPAPRNLKPSVFEDNLTKFTEESTPVQFSTATSISSLTIDDQDEPICGDIQEHKPCNSAKTEEHSEKQDVQEKPDSSSELNEQLSENDEDILADCINIGMQNNRHRHSVRKTPSSKIPSHTAKSSGSSRPQGSGIPVSKTTIPVLRTIPSASRKQSGSFVPSPSVRSDSLHTFDTEGASVLPMHAGTTNSSSSVLSVPNDRKSRKDYSSDDSSNFSGENDNILAECIKSGMPKARTLQERSKKPPLAQRILPTSTPIKSGTSELGNKKPLTFFGAVDEISSFAVENSPCQFSLRSSLSDLTVDGSVAGRIRTMGEGETNPDGESNAAVCNTSRRSVSSAGPSNVHNTTGTSCNTTGELRRQESLSSLSVESFGSGENEQALLEQCISSGMPKTKRVSKPIQERPIGVATKHFNKQAVSSDHEKQHIMSESGTNQSASKNVSAASVAGNTNQHHLAADGEADTRKVGPEESLKTLNPLEHITDAKIERAEMKCAQICHDTLPVKLSPTVENYSTAPMKNGCDSDDVLPKIACYNVALQKSDDELRNRGLVDSRMLDPDAMIESLDRFTAELVSQATLYKEESSFSTSQIEGGDTWTDNIQTIPSLSDSMPHVITFSDKTGDKQDVIDAPTSSPSLTESTLIAMEATKMAATFKKQAEMEQSATSVMTMELDKIEPPSQMNSISGAIDLPKSSAALGRKKSLPGLMVRRALNNSRHQASSLESLIANNSITQLEHINPPSIMGDIDMDGSLISVDSIASDNEDGQFNIGQIGQHPIFNIKNPMISSSSRFQASQTSQIMSGIENVNPPSLFNEVSDMCNSLNDVTTNLGTTDVFEDCASQLQTDNDITEPFSDAHSITPIQSDISSAESTPKKTRSRLTPRERRNESKERYLTYTVDADKIMQRDDEITITDEYRTVCGEDPKSGSADTYRTVGESFSSATYRRSPKLTAKERRQQDQSRFQTQVLSKEVLQDVSSSTNNVATSKIKNNIPRKLNLRKRIDSKGDSPTQTVTETVFSLLETEAKIVLNSLNETNTNTLLDETLSLVSNDGDDSEPNSRCSITYRTYRKSSSVLSNASTGSNLELPHISSDDAHSSDTLNANDEMSGGEQSKGTTPKPKIVKPDTIRPPEPSPTVEQPPEKAVRGRRKPLYSKPVKTTPSPRTITPPKQTTTKLAAKPPMPASQAKSQKVTKTSPGPLLQREGTFTKDDKKTKIPTMSSAIPKAAAASSSRLAKPMNGALTQRSKISTYGSRSAGLVKSASSDRANKPPSRIYNRSPSADSRIAVATSSFKPKAPPSTTATSPKNGAVKKNLSALPVPAAADQESAETRNGQAKKQIRSRIASLLKQVEESKKQISNNRRVDTRVWIEASAPQ